MDDSKWERASAVGGILFIVIVLVAASISGSPPKTSDSAVKISRYITDHDDALRWAGYLSALAALPFLWWMGAIWRMLRRAEGGAPRLAVVAVAGAVLSGALSVVAALILSTMAIFGSRGLGEANRFFYLLSTSMSGAALFGIAVFIGAVSAAAIRTRVLPAALGWFGALVALVAVVGGGVIASTRDAFFTASFAAYLGASLWVVITSVIMLRGLRGLDQPTGTTPAAAGAA
jgi:hypothetical protein